MSPPQKDSFFRWLPALAVIVGLLANFAAFSARAGRMDERTSAHISDAGIHMPLEKRFEMFISRAEYKTRNEQRDQQHEEIVKRFDSLSAKLDRLIERRTGE